MSISIRTLIAAGACAAVSTAAFAQSDKMGKMDKMDKMDAMSLPQKTIGGFEGPDGKIGASEEVVQEVDLRGEFPELDGLETQALRARLVKLEPGGVIGIHEHKDRPNYFRVMQGEITYHGPDGVKSYREGDEVEELGPTPHWWDNRGSTQVVLYAVDVRDKSKDPPK